MQTYLMKKKYAIRSKETIRRSIEEENNKQELTVRERERTI